jgi:phage terminase Nu1 subunit (DNA packaging protein)
VKHLSYSQLVELTDQTHRTVKKRLDTAGISPVVVGARGKAHLFDSSKALAAIYSFVDGRRIRSKKKGASEHLDPHREKALLDKERRRKIELENAEKEKELLPATDCEKFWSDMVINIKTKLLAIPSKLAPVAADLDDPREVQTVAAVLIEEILTELAESAPVNQG